MHYDSGSQTFSNSGSLAKFRFFQGSQCQIFRSAHKIMKKDKIVKNCNISRLPW